MKKLDAFEWLLVLLFVLCIGAGLMAGKRVVTGPVVVSAPDKGEHLRY